MQKNINSKIIGGIHFNNMNIKADELISARNIIDALIDVQRNEHRFKPEEGAYDEDLQSLFAVQDILSTADEYIFDDLETEQEYKNKIRGNNA